jgi:hypothetical protein
MSQVAKLRWSFGQPGLPQSFFVSRKVFGTPIKAQQVFEIGKSCASRDGLNLSPLHRRYLVAISGKADVADIAFL